MDNDKTKNNLSDEQLNEANGGYQTPPSHHKEKQMYCYNCGYSWKAATLMRKHCPKCNSTNVGTEIRPNHGEGSGIT
ncbi:hypothetical protein LJC56_02935 [Christensenellaceae bacterium OttesenSCG-928-K19]|nr:hypothetical protein [Christensenellaceae bacterium OttesenSCG-928-K19]